MREEERGRERKREDERGREREKDIYRLLRGCVSFLSEGA